MRDEKSYVSYNVLNCKKSRYAMYRVYLLYIGVFEVQTLQYLYM